MTDIEAYKNNI